MFDQLIDGALDWVVANQRLFHLPSLEDDERADAVTIEGQRKAFGELSLACLLMSRSDSMRERSHYQALVAYIKKELARPDAFYNMMRRKTLFPFYVTTVVSLAACGIPLPRYRRAIQKILDRGYIDRVERTPWNTIDLRYFLDLGGFRHHLPDNETVFRLSIAHRLPPIPEMRATDTYGITHILFFLSDFGQRDLRALLGTQYGKMCDYVALLLGTELCKGDWDLVGELLLSSHCLRSEANPYAPMAWQALHNAQLGDGQIPGRNYDPDNSDMERAETRASYQFRCNYHPTLVTLLAAMTARAVQRHGYS